MIFHLEDDAQIGQVVGASAESAAPTTSLNQYSRPIPPPLNQGSLRTAGDKAKLYVSCHCRSCVTLTQCC